MPRYLISISPEDERRVWRLIDRGLYRDIQHLLSVALRNQLVAEEEGTNPWEGEEGLVPGPEGLDDVGVPHASSTFATSRGHVEVRFLSTSSYGVPVTLPEPRDDELTATLLWAQFYRFLPLKVAGRVLYIMTQEEPASQEAYTVEALRISAGIYSILRGYDSALRLSSGERLSTSFPRRTEKSRSRFRDQYLPYLRPTDGRLEGFLARMKFANVVWVDGEQEVGLTPPGADFMRLSNPVLDVESPRGESLSEEEIHFLVTHIYHNLPDEYRHMQALIEAVEGGANTPGALDRVMRSFYLNYLERGHTWTDAHISAMRGGVHSRMREMGLVSTTRKGRQVAYSVTSTGLVLLNEGPPGLSQVRETQER
jgi:hypothetical protein